MLKIEQILRNEKGDNVLGESFEQIQVKNGFIFVKKEGLKGLYRIIDNYKKILNPEWDEIRFNGKYIIAERYSKIALFDSDGKEILQRRWDRILLYEKGILVSEGNFQGFYSYTGEAILECIWRRIEPYPKVMLAFRGNGAKRVILGRELNKEQIKEIINNKPEDLDIEIFGHGAICFAYSGRCFLSDFLAGRIGNLGDCAQSCRWAYNDYVEETNNPGNLMPVETDEKGTYIFSSKDLCLINEIPEIIEMGVNSLKIEGRLKTEYYLATVINSYRTAIDDYYNNPKEYNAEKYLKELEKTKTRGLTTFYFNDRNNKDFQDYGGRQYNAEYEFGGKVIEKKDDKVLIEIRNKLSVGDTLELLVPGKIEPIVFKIDNLWDADTLEEIPTVNPGKAEQKVVLRIPYEIEKDWILRRKK